MFAFAHCSTEPASKYTPDDKHCLHCCVHSRAADVIYCLTACSSDVRPPRRYGGNCWSCDSVHMYIVKKTTGKVDYERTKNKYSVHIQPSISTLLQGCYMHVVFVLSLPLTMADEINE